MIKQPMAHLSVTLETWKEIKRLQLDLDMKKFDDVIQYLLKEERTRRSTSSLEDEAEEVYFGQPPPEKEDSTSAPISEGKIKRPDLTEEEKKQIEEGSALVARLLGNREEEK